MNPEAEIIGIDDAEMGEFAYDYVGIDAELGTRGRATVIEMGGNRGQVWRQDNAGKLNRVGLDEDGSSVGEGGSRVGWGMSDGLIESTLLALIFFSVLGSSFSSFLLLLFFVFYVLHWNLHSSYTIAVPFGFYARLVVCLLSSGICSLPICRHIVAVGGLWMHGYIPLLTSMDEWMNKHRGRVLTWVKLHMAYESYLMAIRGLFWKWHSTHRALLLQKLVQQRYCLSPLKW